MSSWLVPGSLRAQLQRVIFGSILLVAVGSLGLAWRLAASARSRDEAAHYLGFSQLIADLVRHPLEISDYSDAERMLGFASREAAIVPAVLTAEGDLLLGDYSRAGDFGLERLGSRVGRSCADVEPALRAGARQIYCSEIVGVRGGLGASERLGLSLVLVRRARIVPMGELAWLFGAMILSLLALSWLLSAYVTRSIVMPLESLRAWARARAAAPLSPEPRGALHFAVEELEDLQRAFGDLLDAVDRESARRQETERELALQTLSRQVAHDIRSPLAALETAAQDISQIPEDKRLLLRSAAARIRDIANSLLEMYRERLPAPERLGAAEGTLLSAAIEPILTEKRIQFRHRSRVSIDAVWNDDSYGLFARVEPVEFGRVLSNLIDNSVEALSSSGGSVQVTLRGSGDWVVVAVTDTGRGIPEEVIRRLGETGLTVGKVGGTGLGLSHARRKCEGWGGRLELSALGEGGTEARLLLPRADPPPWFATRVELERDQPLVILDDDESIHCVWADRLGTLGRALAFRGPVVHLHAADELRTWVAEDAGRARRARYLLDHELVKQRATGLDLAVELSLGARALLVTSWHEDPEVVRGCLSAGVRIVPKGLARLVPLSVTVDGNVDAALIDDDELTRKAWAIAAKRAGKRLASFASVEAFLLAALPRRTPLYVDAELGGAGRGAQGARRVHEEGYTEIHLETGHDPALFSSLGFLRAVRDKQPPW